MDLTKFFRKTRRKMVVHFLYHCMTICPFLCTSNYPWQTVFIKMSLIVEKISPKNLILLQSSTI